MKKRAGVFLLSFIFVLSLCWQGYASGNVNQILFDEEERKTVLGLNENITDVALLQEKLYILFPNHLFQYILGEEQAVKLPEYYNEDSSSPKTSLFVWNDALYGFSLYSGEMFPISTETGKPLYEQKRSLPWENQEDENSTKRFYLQGIMENRLFITEESHEDGNKAHLFSIDLETMEKKIYQTKNIQKLADYKDGKFLAILFENQWLNSPDAVSDEEKPKLVIFDPQKDETALIHQWDDLNVGGLAYEASSGYIYYVIGNQIYRISEKEKPEEVTHISNEMGTYRQKAWVSPQGAYVLWGGWNDGIVVKDIMQTGEASKILRLNGYLNEKVEKAFQKKHSEVLLDTNFPIFEDYPTTLDMAFAIQTGGTQMDVLFPYHETHDFRLLVEKGYAAPITSSFIYEEITKMHPFIQQHMLVNGQVYGVPLGGIHPHTSLSYSPELWQDLGLSEEEMPNTYKDLFLLAAEKKEALEQSHPDRLFFGPGLQSRANLIRLIGRETLNYYQKQGEIVNFDTTTFRNLMALIDRVGLEEEPVYDEDPSSLFFHSPLSGAYAQEQGAVPLFLSLDEGTNPAFLVSGSIAIINAASENKEIATAFLEEVVSNYTPEERVALFAGEHDPIMSDDYITAMASYQEELGVLYQQLQQSQEADKGAIQEKITLTENDMETMEKKYPRITKESIQRYQKHISDFYIPSGPALPDGQGNNSVWLKLNAYIDYEISLEEFIQEANQMAEIIYYENQ